VRHLRFLLLVSLITSVSAAVAVGVTWPFGPRMRFFAATVGGTLGVLAAIRAATELAWLDLDRRRGGTIGALIGLALASPLVGMWLMRPMAALAATLLVGSVAIVGAGRGAVR
jgi:FtsH-binding integral membrane protein